MTGFRAASSLRWKAVLAVIAVVAIYLYHAQNVQTAEEFVKFQDQIDRCKRGAESALAQLSVMYQHKRKLEDSISRAQNDSAVNADELRKSIRSCQLDAMSAKGRLSDCERTLAQENEKVARLAGAVEKKQIPKPMQADQIAVANLERQNADLDAKLREATEELERLRKDQSELTERAVTCEKQLIAHIGASPKANYSRNNSAHFERSHKKEERLEFHRDGDGFKPQPLLPAAELVKRLEEKRKEKEQRKEVEEVHPQDRKENDDYVVEKPNIDEKDYKQGHNEE